MCVLWTYFRLFVLLWRAAPAQSSWAGGSRWVGVWTARGIQGKSRWNTHLPTTGSKTSASQRCSMLCALPMCPCQLFISLQIHICGGSEQPVRKQLVANRVVMSSWCNKELSWRACHCTSASYFIACCFNSLIAAILRASRLAFCLSDKCWKSADGSLFLRLLTPTSIVAAGVRRQAARQIGCRGAICQGASAAGAIYGRATERKICQPSAAIGRQSLPSCARSCRDTWDAATATQVAQRQNGVCHCARSARCWISKRQWLRRLQLDS